MIDEIIEEKSQKINKFENFQFLKGFSKEELIIKIFENSFKTYIGFKDNKKD